MRWCIPEQIAVSGAADAFDEMDHLKDERMAEAARCGAASDRNCEDNSRDWQSNVTRATALIVALDLPSVATRSG